MLVKSWWGLFLVFRVEIGGFVVCVFVGWVRWEIFLFIRCLIWLRVVVELLGVFVWCCVVMVFFMVVEIVVVIVLVSVWRFNWIMFGVVVDWLFCCIIVVGLVFGRLEVGGNGWRCLEWFLGLVVCFLGGMV